MKKQILTSQSAFFNLRLLASVFMALAAIFMALLGLGMFSVASTAQAQPRHKFIIDPNLGIFSPGFDCSRIHELGIDKQENFRAGAIMMACGEGVGGEAPATATSGGTFSSSTFSRNLIKNLPSPSFIGGGDVDVVLPDGTFPHVTQSESMEWCGPNNTCVVNYNDSRTASSCYSGIAYSTDGGATWQHSGQPLCSGHGQNVGDPIVVYNARLNMWFAGDLAGACGGQGVGMWSSPDGITWTAAACAVNTSSGDRESMWVDNNPASPHYGRMYVSYNDFAAGGALRVVYSDTGTAWTGPVTLNGSFIRDIQVTGDLQGGGNVYVASMNENGGGLGQRQNVVYRSTDGGATWASSIAGPSFFGPGRSACSANNYFVCMFGTNNWRHMGWGEPAANGSVVSLDYASCGQNVSCGGSADHGDIYYLRSTDSGVTWAAPFKLNTDTGTAIQWQPSMTTTAAGTIFASWYDGREVNGGGDLNCTAGSSSQNCYRRWGRLSTDNGATWQPDDMVGRSLTPLPGQPDGAVQPNYQGDYDYHSSNGTNIIGGWTDGRNIISGQSQQDVFVNLVSGGSACTVGWSAGGNLPSVGIRLVGVFFPTNGKFYAMGGRSSDGAGSDFTNPFEYNTTTNTWTTKSATYADNTVNNMACGVLTLSGTPEIYCVGGSAAGQTTANARVFYYNPVADSLTYLNAADNWPGDAAGTILPGGFAVYNNKLYIFGGFNINVASTNQIWQFDPNGAVGAKWTQAPVNTPEGVMYAPTCTIGNTIYVAGASDFQGSVIDTTNSFSFNPIGNSIGTIAAIPRATGETRALNFNGKMLVMGGGRVAPNPSNEVDIYDPGTNTWTTGNPVPAFMTARRNFPTDTDGSQHIWLSGGYATDNVTPMNSTEVFCSGNAPQVTGAVSRKTHGAAGTFDINMPQTGSSGVECRTGGATHDYSLVVTFSGNVTVTGSPQSQVVSGVGCVGTGGVCDPNGTVVVNANMVTVPLTNMGDVQVANVQINGVNSASDEPAVNVNIPMGFLAGDVTGNRVVNASDVALTKSQVGQVVGSGNFREDVNANGTITATDVSIVKSDVGHSLP